MADSSVLGYDILMNKLLSRGFLAILLAGCTIYRASDSTTSVPAPMKQEAIITLSNQGLTQLPSAVLKSTSIVSLDISHNRLSGSLPGEIRFLSQLKVLKADHNQMTGVPAEIGQLSNLEELDLSYNQLTGLPQELGNLQHLKLLRLTGNAYSNQDLTVIKKSLPNTTVIEL